MENLLAAFLAHEIENSSRGSPEGASQFSREEALATMEQLRKAKAEKAEAETVKKTTVPESVTFEPGSFVILKEGIEKKVPSSRHPGVVLKQELQEIYAGGIENKTARVDVQLAVIWDHKYVIVWLPSWELEEAAVTKGQASKLEDFKTRVETTSAENFPVDEFVTFTAGHDPNQFGTPDLPMLVLEHGNVPSFKKNPSSVDFLSTYDIKVGLLIRNKFHALWTNSWRLEKFKIPEDEVEIEGESGIH